MVTKIKLPRKFLTRLKRLARKYPSVLQEFNGLSKELENGQILGDQIPNVGYEVYKVRLKNPFGGQR
jgi:hypothetical protein